jgi:hypothetical protein
MKTVGIGSLPHKSIQHAITYSLRHDLPFLPQMIQNGERMIPQVMGQDILLEKYSALEFFTEQILEQKLTQFKIQLAGPETCKTSDKIILQQILNFIKYFDNYNLKPIIFIDEPVLVPESIYLKNIFSEINKLGYISGLHSCAKVDIGKLEYLDNNFLSFDLSLTTVIEKTKKSLIYGIPPFSTSKYKFDGEWISSSCGLASFTENDCEIILRNLENYK